MKCYVPMEAYCLAACAEKGSLWRRNASIYSSTAKNVVFAHADTCMHVHALHNKISMEDFSFHNLPLPAVSWSRRIHILQLQVRRLMLKLASKLEMIKWLLESRTEKGQRWWFVCCHLCIWTLKTGLDSNTCIAATCYKLYGAIM